MRSVRCGEPDYTRPCKLVDSSEERWAGFEKSLSRSVNNSICILEDHCLQWGQWTGGDEIRDLEARRTVGKLLPQALSYRRESADGKKRGKWV